MFLEKRTYVKNWDWMKPEERHEVAVSRGGHPTTIKPERVTFIIEEVAYWRKANAIHRWFVEHAQDGTDDCKEYGVSETHLRALLADCTAVLESSTRRLAAVHDQRIAATMLDLAAGRLSPDSEVLN